MRSFIFGLALWLCLGAWGVAQQQPQPWPGPNQAPPGTEPDQGKDNPDQDKQDQDRQDQVKQDQNNQNQDKQSPEKQKDREAEAGESSSRDTRIDVSPPKNDAKDHPRSAAPVTAPEEQPASDVQEFSPWNPYKAGKDVEVGDFYFRRKSYHAALARYQDALVWKDNDAVAHFRLAQCYEKLDQPDQAVIHYKEYLKILPQGPFSKDAHKALEKLGSPEKKSEAAEKASPPQ
jgi:tetratricopeptide (TPR) repeat protein